MIYSSTILKYFDQHCPKAMGMVIDNHPQDKEGFQAGIAAHAVLQEVANKKAYDFEDQLTVALATVEELISKGRSFQGRQEPPMAPSKAFAGSDIALGYLLWNALPESILSVEGGYGMTDTGQNCGYYEEACRFRAVIDLIYDELVGDEDYAATALVVRDYKSAWPTNEADLDTLQRNGQAVLAWKQHGKDYDIIRQEAVNLQTGRSFTRDIRLDDEGIDLLMKWEKQILMTCTAADRTRAARPGAGCIGCPFVLSCDEALAFSDTDKVASEYAVLLARTQALASGLRVATKHEMIELDNGGKVGYRKQVKQVPAPNAHQLLAEIFTQDDDALPFVKGILQAEKLTAANIDAVLKKVFPGRGKEGKANMETRKTYLEDLLVDKAESRFGVWRDGK